MLSEAPKPDSNENAVWMQCSDSRYVKSYVSQHKWHSRNVSISQWHYYILHVIHVLAHYRQEEEEDFFCIVHCVGAHPLFNTLSQWRLNPINLAYSPSPPDNGLGQYVSSPGNRAYCYAELAVLPCDGRNHRQYSFCLPAEGWPGWAGLGGWLHTKMVYPFWRWSPIQVLTGPGVD